MQRKPVTLLLLALLAPPALLSAQVAVLGALTRDFRVEPGRSYQGSIEVNNAGNRPQEVKAYLSDYSFLASGSTTYGEPGSLARSNAPWTIVSPSQMIVPPGETSSFTFTIQVPEDATLRGSYWSILMIEPVAPSSPESSKGGEPGSLGLSQMIRYGVQLVTQVGDSGSSSLRFSQLRLAAVEGKRYVRADVENDGERWLRGKLTLELYDSRGSRVGSFEGGARRLYPGTSARYEVELAGVAPGMYKALIVVDCGADDVFGVNVNLQLKE